MSEHTVLFGESRTLVGIINVPDDRRGDDGRPALLLLNAGLVHRVGPHRLHVKLARHIVEKGFVVVRYDMSGLGDSLTRRDNLPYDESILLEVKEVMDRVGELTGNRTFCLVGLSSGALLSIQSALSDRRVVGVGLLNPHGFVLANEWNEYIENLFAARIYGTNLLKPKSWLKAVTGKTNYRLMVQSLYYRLASIFKQPEEVSSSAEVVRKGLKQLFSLDSRILLLFAGSDRSIDNFHQLFGSRWQQKLGSNVSEVTVPEANHTFANPVHQQQAITAITDWMIECWPASQEAAQDIAPGMLWTMDE